MEVDVNRLSADLGGLIGKEYVFVDKPTNLLYAKDIMPWDVEEHYMPYAVARPAGAGDVSAVLRYANGAYYNLLLQLKRTLDPKNILNRGNIEVAT